ncbi:MAG: transmembrane DoxX protein [Deltaproteobacteria bacterium CG11_big_fil_rev_8_21_14_0_20_45_16]|nr:MAG: transmembrane DoxX protein [Deltaproteobacteria bacterium CG11_big_fil_rev_8_21_14_0_20_45_16]
MKELLKDIGLLLLRLVAGGTMLFSHGWDKLMSFGERMNVFPDPLGIGSSLSLGLAIFAEFGCAALLILGVTTRLVAIPLAITMGVAYFIVHNGDAFAQRELAFLYLGMFLSLIALGGGKFCVLKNQKFPFA